jgi:very-short-patch-repair endonuclease
MKLFDIILEKFELDEAPPAKTEKEWLKELKKKYSNWDYSNAQIFKDDDNNLKINNVYCKIHKHSFPENGGISIYNHKNGLGCGDCGKESKSKKLSEKNRPTESQLKIKLSNIEKLKDTCDFSKSKFSFVEPLDKGPLVTNTKCKIHNKFFNGGKNDQGIRVAFFKHYDYPCPYCRKDLNFELNATSLEDWIIKFKSNERNKNYDYSKSKVEYDYSKGSKEGKGRSIVSNITCNVTGLNGKKHGVFAKNGLDAQNHIAGYSQCPKCECETKQTENIKDFIERHGDTYVYDKVDFCDPNTIVNGRSKILIGCKEPNHGYFFQEPYNHKIGQGCPICRASKGEKYIGSLLKSKFGEKYKVEKESNLGFNILNRKRCDFYIPELKVVIEYDGEGHFWPVFGTSEYSRNLKYNEIFESDNLKNTIIKSKKSNSIGIRLIRVPYTMEFNEIDAPLLDAIKNTPPNTITYLGEYPRRHNRKEVQSQFKINESKLSLMGLL